MYKNSRQINDDTIVNFKTLHQALETVQKKLPEPQAKEIQETIKYFNKFEQGHNHAVVATLTANTTTNILVCLEFLHALHSEYQLKFNKFSQALDNYLLRIHKNYAITPREKATIVANGFG